MGGAYNDRKFGRIVQWWRWFALALGEQVTCPTFTSNRRPPPSSASRLSLSGDATPHCASAGLCMPRRVPLDGLIATVACDPPRRWRVLKRSAGEAARGGGLHGTTHPADTPEGALRGWVSSRVCRCPLFGLRRPKRGRMATRCGLPQRPIPLLARLFPPPPLAIVRPGSPVACRVA